MQSRLIPIKKTGWLSDLYGREVLRRRIVYRLFLMEFEPTRKKRCGTLSLKGRSLAALRPKAYIHLVFDEQSSSD